MEELKRNRIIVRTSIIGIIANAFLAGFKAFVGTMTGSIAIMLDAVNNLSDMLSSLVTIIGTHLAAKPADKDHPLGHGRVEYISAMVVAVIILYAGVTSLVESAKKILDPAVPEYTRLSLIIVGVAVAVKLVLGRYVRAVGVRVNSGALEGSGRDALNDAVISAATLLAAVVFMVFHVSVEAWLGLVIAAIIIKAGVDMMKETISNILGNRIDRELALGIKATVMEFEGVGGAYDLVLHNYGPDRLVGSIHIEVPDTYTADKIDALTRKIQRRVMEKYGIVLAGVGIYSMNTKNDRAAALRTKVIETVNEHPEIIQMHGFYLDDESRTVSFDIVVDFTAADSQALYEHIHEEMHELLPGYHVHINLDANISD